MKSPSKNLLPQVNLREYHLHHLIQANLQHIHMFLNHQLNSRRSPLFDLGHVEHIY